MDADTLATVRHCTLDSDAGRRPFPQVVAALTRAGVERYHADLILAQKTYYLPDGDAETVTCAGLDAAPADSFDAAQVEQAVRASQAGAIDYRTFCARIAGAGCVGYHVSLPGRRAVYYGRTGEVHVEHFPD